MPFWFTNIGRKRARFRRATSHYTLFEYIYIFAVLCCIPQIVYLLYMYSTLKLSTQIMIHYPDEYYLPSLSFCLPIVTMLDLQKLNSSEPNLLQLLSNRTGLRLNNESDFLLAMRKLDARDELVWLLDQHVGISRLSDYLLEKQQVVVSVEINGVKNLPPSHSTKPLNSEQVGQQYCRLDYVNIRWLVCVTITCKLNVKSRLRLEQQRIINLNRDRGVIARVHLHEQVMRRNGMMKVYIHYTSLPKGLLLPFSIVELHDAPHLYMFQFKMLVIKFLVCFQSQPDLTFNHMILAGI